MILFNEIVVPNIQTFNYLVNRYFPQSEKLVLDAIPTIILQMYISRYNANTTKT